MAKSKIKDSKTDRIFHIVNIIILFAFMLVIIIPVMYIVASSFSKAEAVISGKVFLWPVEPTLEGYKGVFQNKNIVSGFRNSFLYMFIHTVLGVSMTILAAYPLSIKTLPGLKGINMFFTFTMLFAGGLIPTYLLIKNLGMIDTIWSVTIPGALSVYNMMLMKSFFKNGPYEEIYEAASIDGCSVFRYLLQFVIPLSGAIIAIIALYTAVWSWNSWFNAMLYLKAPQRFPLQLILRDILVMSKVDFSMMDPEDIARQQAMADLLKYSVIVVSSLPMMILYPFVQKYFVKGVMAGAVKG